MFFGSDSFKINQGHNITKIKKQENSYKQVNYQNSHLQIITQLDIHQRVPQGKNQLQRGKTIIKIPFFVEIQDLATKLIIVFKLHFFLNQKPLILT